MCLEAGLRRDRDDGGGGVRTMAAGSASAADKLASIGTGVRSLVASDGIEHRVGWKLEREARKRPRMVDGGGDAAVGAAAV